MAYYTVKWIGKKTKRPYLYRQESHRIPGRKKPKTTSTYIGPLAAVGVALKLSVKIATDAKTRALFTKSNEEILEKTPTVKSEPNVIGLGFRSGTTAEEVFQHESGTSAPFASEAQPSESGDASGSAK